MECKRLTHRREWKSVLIDLMLKVVRRIDDGLLDDCEPIFGRDPAHTRDPIMNLCHQLAGLFNQGVAAHRLYSAEVAVVEDLCRQRDEHVVRLRDLLVSLRGLMSAAYGSAGLLALGFDGSTPREPENVARQAGLTAQNLRDPRRELPPASQTPVTLDTERVATTLRDGAATLQHTFKVLREARIRRDSARGYRNESLARFDAVATGAARFLRGFCELTDQHDVVEQVRTAQAQSRRQI